MNYFDITRKQEGEAKNNDKNNVSSPIEQVGLVGRFVADLTQHSTANRLFGGYNNYISKNKSNDNLNNILKNINESTHKKNSIDFFYAIHNIFLNSLNTFFTGFGVLNESKEYVDFKLVNNSGATYSNRIFMYEDNHPFVKVIQNSSKETLLDTSFLNIPYLPATQLLVLPLIVQNETIGVFVVGDNSSEIHSCIFENAGNILGLKIACEEFSSNSHTSSSVDSLTNLCTHRKFQEKLAKSLSTAKKLNQQLAIILFDVNDISEINKTHGHAKGDEIIKKIAQVVQKNSRPNDIAGRYGGDEIALLLPDTDAKEAKYIAEYISYLLSCTIIDSIGPIKVSIGMATYPNSHTEQEKLLILAEQAMCISMSKGYQNGISTIVCSDDFDFWDDVAIHSFTSVLVKRHAQVGINFDEELIKKFNSQEIQSQKHLIEVVTSLAAAIDAKDTYTKGHSTAVSTFAQALARAINLPEKDVERIKLGALLHDIGKIGIPEQVLRKPTKLSDEEWAIMKQHPEIGAMKVLEPNPSLHDLIPIVKYHHEHWDGNGYPEGLKGENIPLEARIVAVADCYHALISDRPYRKGMSVQKACEILKMGANIQWDGNLVRQFITIAPSLGLEK